MAKSPSHKFGQIIGELLERATIEQIRPFIQKHNMYLDNKHERPARNNRAKVRWEDANGNFHDLDLVVEEGGSEEHIGEPRAFIEVAWRRYTKHSKNKAQEISGAVLPIVERFPNKAPFKGAVLAGEFTQTSIEQLKSEGFSVLHFSYEEVIRAFESVGIDAYFDETTPEIEFDGKAASFDKLSRSDKEKIKSHLFANKGHELDQFLQALDKSLERSIRCIFITTLYGSEQKFQSVDEACSFISGTNRTSDSGEPLARIEIRVEYTNGDNIQFSFEDPIIAASQMRAIA